MKAQYIGNHDKMVKYAIYNLWLIDYDEIEECWKAKVWTEDGFIWLPLRHFVGQAVIKERGLQ